MLQMGLRRAKIACSPHPKRVGTLRHGPLDPRPRRIGRFELWRLLSLAGGLQRHMFRLRMERQFTRAGFTARTLRASDTRDNPRDETALESLACHSGHAPASNSDCVSRWDTPPYSFPSQS